MAKHFQVDTGSTLTTGLISYYKFANDTNDFFNENNLTNSGPTYSADGPTGASGNSYDWGTTDANNNYMVSAGAIVGATYSMSMWVKWNNVGSNNYLIDYGDNNNPTQHQTQIYTDSQGPSSTTVPNGAWHHIIVTKNGSGGALKIYQNGTETFSGTGSSTTPSTVTIGNYGNASHGYGWNGKIAEVGLWNKVLSAQEITDLYNSGNGQTMADQQILTLTCDYGAFTLTGQDATIGKLYTLICDVGNYVLTGFDATLKFVGWIFGQTKDSSSWTSSQTKESGSWTSQTKDSSSWTEQTK